MSVGKQLGGGGNWGHWVYHRHQAEESMKVLGRPSLARLFLPGKGSPGEEMVEVMG